MDLLDENIVLQIALFQLNTEQFNESSKWALYDRNDMNMWFTNYFMITWKQTIFSHLNTAKHNHIVLHANAQNDLPMKMRIKTANVHKNKNKRTLM